MPPSAGSQPYYAEIIHGSPWPRGRPDLNRAQVLCHAAPLNPLSVPPLLPQPMGGVSPWAGLWHCSTQDILPKSSFVPVSLTHVDLICPSDPSSYLPSPRPSLPLPLPRQIRPSHVPIPLMHMLLMADRNSSELSCSASWIR